MAERSTIVADASIVGRWYVNSPPHVQDARRVRDDFDDGKITLAAPENLLHEVTGAIHQAVFASRLNARQATEQLEHFLSRDIAFVETNDLVRPAWDLSLRYGCSYYDAIYLEIARRQNCPFVHADGRLRRALAGRFPLEVWIEEYHSR